MTRSKYVQEYYESFYDFYYLSFVPYTKFKKGQEDKFMETMNDFKNSYGRNSLDVKAEEDLKYVMERSDLDWNKIWEQVDLKDYDGPLKTLIEELPCYIKWAEFKKKVNMCNDLVLVERLYHYYCWRKDINNNKEEKSYIEYLNTALGRMKKTPEDVLCEMIDDFHDSFERGYAPDTVRDVLQNSKIRLFKVLIKEANLDTLVDYKNKKVPLKNLLLYRILKYGEISEWYHDNDEPDFTIDNKNRLKDLLNGCDDTIFTGELLNDNFVNYDKVTLNIMMSDIDKAFEVFDNKKYPLYNPDELKSLYEKGTYQTNKPFTDKFALVVDFIALKDSNAFRENGCYQNDFIDLIYNSKIKVIAYRTLMIIKDYLDEDEFANYIKHIKENNITIYFGDYLGFKEDNPMIRTLDNALNNDVTPIEKIEAKKIQELLDNYNNKTYKKIS